MLKGEKVYLEAIEPEDLVKMREWRNKPDYRKYFREYRELNSQMQQNWYQTKVINDPSTIMFSIKLLDRNELIGCCGFCYINWVNRNSDLSLYIGWRDTYIDSEGYAKECCELLFDYGFNELGLKKIWTEIYEFDSLKYQLYCGLGFKRDGILRNHYYYDGKWWDSYILSLLFEEYNANGRI